MTPLIVFMPRKVKSFSESSSDPPPHGTSQPARHQAHLNRPHEESLQSQKPMSQPVSGCLFTVTSDFTSGYP